MKKSTKRDLAAVAAEVFEQAHKATAVIDIINRFDGYVPEYQIGKMSIPQAWEELEKQRDTRKDIKGLVEASKAQGDRIEGKVGNLPKGLKAAAKEGAKTGVEGTLPKVYAKAANMSDEELRNAAKPKTRSSGGGRKKERDLGDTQVKAALKYADNHSDIGLRAACDHIVRTMKESDFKKPYMTAKDLDAAVRRYCKKTSQRIPSKTRSGRWSAKS